MTAEIAIMNKNYAALAADSAVSTSFNDSKRIYPSARKLFMLSSHQPIGIMVYGKADFMEIGWEKIIKLYCDRSTCVSFPTVREYADDFLRYLEAESRYYSDDQQENYFSQTVFRFFASIRDKVWKAVDSGDGDRGFPDRELSTVAESIIRECADSVENAEPNPGFVHEIPEDVYIETLQKKYGSVAGDTFDILFEEIPVSRKMKKRAVNASLMLFCRQYSVMPPSGIVFAGFGSDELFPALCSYTVEGLLEGKLKYVHETSTRVSVNRSAVIIPFARTETVFSFMEGIDPEYLRYIQAELRGYCGLAAKKTASVIRDRYGVSDGTLEEAIQEILASDLEDFLSDLSDWGHVHYTTPVLNMVDISPIDELARMAELLVGLASYKRDISSDQETVGGPVDVAVISKVDGFVWIRRKEYYDRELNRHITGNSC
ncbi:MAG: hypothetical protein ACOCWH_01615 [Spirochaetota bacterium]